MEDEENKRGVSEKLIEKEALEDMNTNAEIKGIDIDVFYRFKVKGKYDDGAARAGRNTRRKTLKREVDDFSVIWDFVTRPSEESKLDFINSEFLNLFEAYESVDKFSFDILVEITGQFRYFTGRTVVGKRTLEITPSVFESSLFITGVDSEIKIVKETETMVMIDFGEETVSFSRKEEPNEVSLELSSEMEKFVYSYLSDSGVWSDGLFRIQEGDNELCLLFEMSEKTAVEKFKPPFLDNSELEKILEIFGYSDPQNLEGENFAFSLVGATVVGEKYKLVRLRKKRASVPLLEKTSDKVLRLSDRLGLWFT